MHIVDLKSYLEADQRLLELYADPNAWLARITLNIASSGKFPNDRTIGEFASGIQNAELCPVP